MPSKKTVKDPYPGAYDLKPRPQNVTRALPRDATRIRNTGSPVGPEHPRTVPKGTGTKSPL